MIRITDKSFQYTPSYNTDLRKKFRKMQQEQRAADARERAAYATQDKSVVELGSRRSQPKN